MKTSRFVLLASLAAALGAQSFAQPEVAQIPSLPPNLPSGVPAFPGAWGGGMFTTGGRGGRVIAVTNLDDSGPGSFRAALEAEGARIVVFRVAGTIYLKSKIDIVHPDITIAGQSAPGDGICVAHDSININTRNVIIRHLRVRRGLPGGQGSDNIGGYPLGQVIVDHCSVSWGRDENISLYRYIQNRTSDGAYEKWPVKNLTIQWVVSSEALGPGHEFGGTWGGEDATFHHNLFANNTGRNPSIGMGGEFDYRNNVLFNWGHRTMDGGDEGSMVNVISNYYKPGPATKDDMVSTIVRMEERNQNSPMKFLEAGNWFPKAEKRPGKWYVAGNIVEGHDTVTSDNWKGVRGNEKLARVNTPFEGWPVAQQTAQDAYAAVLAKGGATLPKRDVVDTRVLEMVRTGNVLAGRGGIIRDPKEVGGYPELKFDAAQVPVDSDGDGLPDAWETQHGLDPKNVADGAQDADGDGYTNIEEFLNGTNPREKIDYRNFANNVDTIS
ncbi:polysaccharide lyase [Oleiharenicola lentus]|uniref:polysaccharide lyase n=1 Tax=Oleiharenicola lentus TaxID=2508720 RepID=UPI003F6733ED